MIKCLQVDERTLVRILKIPHSKQTRRNERSLRLQADTETIRTCLRTMRWSMRKTVSLWNSSQTAPSRFLSFSVNAEMLSPPAELDSRSTQWTFCARRKYHVQSKVNLEWRGKCLKLTTSSLTGAILRVVTTLQTVRWKTCGQSRPWNCCSSWRLESRELACPAANGEGCVAERPGSHPHGVGASVKSSRRDANKQNNITHAAKCPWRWLADTAATSAAPSVLPRQRQWTLNAAAAGAANNRRRSLRDCREKRDFQFQASEPTEIEIETETEWQLKSKRKGEFGSSAELKPLNHSPKFGTTCRHHVDGGNVLPKLYHRSWLQYTAR